MENRELSITIAAVTGEQVILAGRIEEFLATHDVPWPVSIKLMIALDEVVTNIVSYAYGPHATDPFARITVAIAVDTVTIEVVDAGCAFDPLAATPPDTSLGVEERSLGGLGILLVRKQMDSVKYVRRDGLNRLTLVKALR